MCLAFFFSCSSVYPTFYDIVDGFDIDKLFTRQHGAPTTIPATTESDASLAAISTVMPNIRSKNIAQSADNNKEETIDYNYMQKDVHERCYLNNNPVKIIAKRYLAKFSNKLIVDTSKIQQDWNFVEYPEIGTTTWNHPGQP